MAAIRSATQRVDPRKLPIAHRDIDPFNWAARLNEIHAKCSGDADFFVIYIREAHSDDGWRVPENLQ